jgi:hypothetical protein
VKGERRGDKPRRSETGEVWWRTQLLFEKQRTHKIIIIVGLNVKLKRFAGPF